MKFSQLAIGERFSYQGRRYRKVSPLIAVEDGGGQRMIARAARVTPESGAGEAGPAAAGDDPVRRAARAYHDRCLAVVTELAGRLGEEECEAARQALERALAAFEQCLADHE